MTTPQLRTRPPTGIVPWPLLLVEGGEKSGKSWSAALLTTSPRVGRSFWLDLGEGAGDEYGAIPGAAYELLVHDGTFGDYLGQVQAVHELAGKAAAAGEPPVLLVIDTMTDEWEGLKDWASSRAVERAARRGRKVTAEEAKVTSDLWNDAGARHRRLMTLLLTFPGVVVMIARGKEVAKIGDNGQPVEGEKTYRVEGHKSLPYDASVWVRLDREAPALIVGCRSVKYGVRPGRDKPKRCPDDVDNLLEWVVFDVLGCDPATAKPRDIKHTTGGELTPEEAGETPEDGARRRIRELSERHGWDLAAIAERFRTEQRQDIRTAELEPLEAFLADLQQDAAVEAASAAPAVPDRRAGRGRR